MQDLARSWQDPQPGSNSVSRGQHLQYIQGADSTSYEKWQKEKLSSKLGNTWTTDKLCRNHQNGHFKRKYNSPLKPSFDSRAIPSGFETSSFIRWYTVIWFRIIHDPTNSKMNTSEWEASGLCCKMLTFHFRFCVLPIDEPADSGDLLERDFTTDVTSCDYYHKLNWIWWELCQGSSI